MSKRGYGELNIPWGKVYGYATKWMKPRRYVPPTSRKKRWTTAGQKALWEVRQLRKGQEVKNIYENDQYSLALVDTNSWDAGDACVLNGCVQGNQTGQRCGKYTKPIDLMIRFSIKCSTETSPTAFRAVIIYDRDPQGAFPSPTDIWVSDLTHSPLNREFGTRFKVLMDRSYTIGTGNGVGNQNMIFDKVYLNLRKLPKTNYGAGNAGTIADINSGALYFWVSSFNLTDSAATLDFYSVFKYVDS